MSDDEKKFRLDELPDEGSIPEPPRVPRKQNPKKSSDPRLEKLNQLDHEGKVDTMIRKWTFDSPVYHFTWMAFTGLILAFQWTPLHAFYISLYQKLLAWGEFFPEVFFILGPLLRHPVGLLLLLPLFKFKEKSEYAFTVTFDGIHTVRRVLPIGSKEVVTQVFLRWAQIEAVKLKRVGKKEILALFSGGEHIADIIWYISTEKKKAMGLVLKELVPKEHALRVYLETEKE